LSKVDTPIALLKIFFVCVRLCTSVAILFFCHRLTQKNTDNYYIKIYFFI